MSNTPPSPGRAKRDLLEPYVPPNVPHGLPHVVRFATLSSMDLPVEARFLIVMLARFADPSAGQASVALDTLCAICRIGSHHTVTRYITMAEEIGILKKEPGQGGKDRQSNRYQFLGGERQWRPLPVGHPDDKPGHRPGRGPPAHRAAGVPGGPDPRTGGPGGPGGGAGSRAGGSQERRSHRAQPSDGWRVPIPKKDLSPAAMRRKTQALPTRMVHAHPSLRSDGWYERRPS